MRGRTLAAFFVVASLFAPFALVAEESQPCGHWSDECLGCPPAFHCESELNPDPEAKGRELCSVALWYLPPGNEPTRIQILALAFERERCEGVCEKIESARCRLDFVKERIPLTLDTATAGCDWVFPNGSLLSEMLERRFVKRSRMVGIAIAPAKQIKVFCS